MSDSVHPSGAPRRPAALRWLRRSLGPLLLVVILASVDRRALLQAFASADGALLLLAYAAVAPTVPIRASRWGLLGARGSFLGRLLAYAYALFVGVATPGRIGEFVKTAHLTAGGMSFGRAFSSVLLDRLFDVGFLLLFAGFGLSVLALPLQSDLATPGIVAALCFGIALAVYVTRPGPAERIGRFVVAAAPARYAAWIDENLREFFSSMRELSRGALLLSALSTAAAWLLTYASNYMFSLALGLELSFAQIAGISAVCSLVALLPVSILGAGTRDAVLILLLSRYGYDPPQAVALSTLFLSLSLWTGLLCAPASLSRQVRAARDEGASDKQPAPPRQRE